jgi:hypothetical protein
MSRNGYPYYLIDYGYLREDGKIYGDSSFRTKKEAMADWKKVYRKRYTQE